ncbi:protein JINGUBANG-like [Carica papaya]|uniref:protein JINGUBANG-like n=1 Tax=Carica papaya TaxID=3649 RepID=UPI000B8CB1F9|nr:protein JINGUBANG-like [Carica papaya]
MSSHNLSALCVRTLKCRYSISCLAVHNNLLYAASINEINVYDLSNYTQVDVFNGDYSTSGFVKSIVFKGINIFTAHQDCKIRIWKITPNKQHKLVSTLPTVKDRFLRFMLPNNYITIRRHKKRLWIEHCDTVSSLVVNGGLVYSVSWDKSLKIWNRKNHRCLQSVKAHEDAINTMVVSEKGTVYTGSADGRIRIWERDDKEKRHSLVATLEMHKSTVNALAINGYGSVLFSGGCEGSILVWEKEDSERRMGLVEALWGHTGAILCMINVRELLVSGSSDQTVRVWRRGKEGGYSCRVVLPGHATAVKSVVAVSRNGVASVCSGSVDGVVKVWEISTPNTSSF